MKNNRSHSSFMNDVFSLSVKFYNCAVKLSAIFLFKKVKRKKNLSVYLKCMILTIDGKDSKLAQITISLLLSTLEIIIAKLSNQAHHLVCTFYGDRHTYIVLKATATFPD